MIQDKTILGLTEEVTVIGPHKKQKVMARIDTGATASSIDTTLAAALNLGPMTKSKIVKSASGIKKRPLIKVKVVMDGQTIEEEFNVADRAHMTYQILIGQNILKKGNFLIDPHKEVAP
ncbi:MAG TPA: RimK/LysX family protein [Candidatus Nanoarchaeia archaeon]|nr:RimK/LysX family protein [Candidatus Nanoarchaeia archaeon]